MNIMEVSATTARRYLLGRQGLWPGRRWAGRRGTARALHAIEMLQMDPLHIVARSHDLALHSRVCEYKPEYLDALLYQKREFFDAGGALEVRPMRELPYWRVVMRRKTATGRWGAFGALHAEAVEAARAELRLNGPLGNRDFVGGPRISDYRGRKLSALALFYLWLSGEVMTHHRRNFERVYAFREQVAPPAYDYEAPEPEAERFLMRKWVAHHGLVTARAWQRTAPWELERPVSREESRRWLDEAVAAGELAAVTVEGHAEPYFVLAHDARHLKALEAGRVPRAWQPLGTTTETEAVFLAPLDIVSARGRSKLWFDFDYVWEVYKPASQRRWGYYVLPILWGDRLVGRLDPRLDRSTGSLIIEGFWLEQRETGRDEVFAAALARGLASLARFVAAKRIETRAVRPARLKAFLKTELKKQL
jgi:uncharacterized protein YcaQ